MREPGSARRRAAAIAAIAGLIFAVWHGGSAGADDTPDSLTEALAEVAIDIDRTSVDDHRRIDADGISPERARRVAMAEHPDAESAEVFTSRFVDPSTGERSLVYVVVLEGVKIPLRRGYDPDAEDVPPSYVTVRWSMFIDAVSGEVIMGTNF